MKNQGNVRNIIVNKKYYFLVFFTWYVFIYVVLSVYLAGVDL